MFVFQSLAGIISDGRTVPPLVSGSPFEMAVSVNGAPVAPQAAPLTHWDRPGLLFHTCCCKSESSHFTKVMLIPFSGNSRDDI